jgi:hypothetical protein
MSGWPLSRIFVTRTASEENTQPGLSDSRPNRNLRSQVTALPSTITTSPFMQAVANRDHEYGIFGKFFRMA